VAVDNRLTVEQLAALAPGDVVAIEISADFRKPRYSARTVWRLEGSCIASRGAVPVGFLTSTGTPCATDRAGRTGIGKIPGLHPADGEQHRSSP